MVLTGTRRWSVVVTVAAGLALAGCSGGSSSDGAGPSGSGAPTSLEGTAWTLATYAGAGGAAQPAAAGAAATLAFSPASRLTGSTGCNTFGGTWTQDGSGLTLSPGPATTKACPGALGTQETAVLAELQRTASYAVVAGTLRLSSSDGAPLLTYLPALAGLSGSSWSATGVANGKGGVTSVPTGVVVTAEFGTDGMLTGTGGCNTYSGTYEEGTDGALTIGAIGATAKGCADPAGATEALYLTALGSVATYAIDGRTLTLRDSSGATLVTYQVA